MGKRIATYLVRVTLHERNDHAALEQWQEGPPEPDNAAIERIVRDAIYAEVEYYTADVIGVSAERVDE